MSLDIVLLGAGGTPEKSTSIGADAHHRLLTLAAGRFLLLNRISEYYEDASYYFDELENLRVEVSALEPYVAGDSELCRFLRELIALIDVARSRSSGLAVIAD